MTDNNQIDVSDCEFYDKNCKAQCFLHYADDYSKRCEDNPSCYYKQLTLEKQKFEDFFIKNEELVTDLEMKVHKLEQKLQKKYDEIGLLKMRLEATEHQDGVALAEREQIIREKDAEIEDLKNYKGAYNALLKKFEELQNLDYSSMLFTERKIMQGDIRLLREIIKESRKKDADIEKLKEALEKIAKHDMLPCAKKCDYFQGECDDKSSDYGKRCPVGIAKQALEGK